MRVLVTAFVPSHFMQMVPTVWALRAAGHQVVVAGMADIVKVARTAGLPTREIGKGSGGFTANVKPGQLGAVKVAEPPKAQGIPSARELAEKRPWEMMKPYWRSLVEGSTGEYVEFGRQWRADLVLCELDFVGLVAGGALGIPTVLHRWGTDVLSPLIHEHATAALEQTCVDLGVLGGFPYPDLVIDPCPPRLQFPGFDRTMPVRYNPYNGTGEVPDWALERGVRRIFVSLGMLGTQSVESEWRRGLVDGIAQAVGDLGEVEVVLPFGAAAAEELGPLPSMMRLVDPVPLNLFMDNCDLVIHHGGAGTSLTACAFGVPQLVLPQIHPAHVGCGERVAENGLGLMLPPDAVTDDPAALGKAIRALLDEPQYRHSAREMAEEMAKQPSTHELDAALRALVAR